MKNRSRPVLVITAAAALLAAVPARAQTSSPTPTPNSTPVGYVTAFKVTASAPLADRQARTSTRLGQRMVSGETQLLTNFRALYNEVWHNADGLTPQQVCDALGTKAADLFVIAGTMAGALYNIDPAGIGTMVNVPAGYAATPHADGTVTITYTAPAAASPTP